MGGADIIILLGAVIVGLVAHMGLILLWRKLNPLFLIAAAFSVLAPLSAGKDFPLVGETKLARVYCTVLMALVGVLIMRVFRPRGAGLAFTLFVGYYVLAGLYSDLPLAALQFKGLYALVVVAGISLAYSIRDLADLRNGLRILLCAAVVFALVLLAEIVKNPYVLSAVGRLTPWGVNPNRVGHEVGAMLLVAAAVALYDPSKVWKILGYALGGFFAIVVLSTGSRGSAGMVAVGGLIIGLPAVRRPGLLIATVVAGALTFYLALPLVSPETTERLTDTNLSDRQALWNTALRDLQDSPLIGQGWVYSSELREGGSTANRHSTYMNILAETGLLGMAFFMIALAFIGLRGLRMFLTLRAERTTESRYAYFALALAAAVLAHCFVESSTIVGSSINALFLPFSFGLFDRLYEIALARRDEAELMTYDADLADDEGNAQGVPASYS